MKSIFVTVISVLKEFIIHYITVVNIYMYVSMHVCMYVCMYDQHLQCQYLTGCVKTDLITLDRKLDTHKILCMYYY